MANHRVQHLFQLSGQQKDELLLFWCFNDTANKPWKFHVYLNHVSSLKVDHAEKSITDRPHVSYEDFKSTRSKVFSCFTFSFFHLFFTFLCQEQERLLQCMISIYFNPLLL